MAQEAGSVRSMCFRFLLMGTSAVLHMVERLMNIFRDE